MSEHTPGPWTYDRDSEEVHGPDGECIGCFEPASGPLAAAAPDLLEALRKMADCVEAHSTGGICHADHEDMVKAADAAIAKARGSR